MKNTTQLFKWNRIREVLCLVSVAFAAIGVGAYEYPLEWIGMSASEALATPGNAGSFCGSQKPSSLFNENQAISSRPLYGQFGGAVFRLDESKGTGKGYDRLCVDANLNGDLRDDPVFRKAVGGADYVFGPFPYPGKATLNGNPGLYARLTLYGGAEAQRRSVNLNGYLLLKPAQYLGATVEIEGIHQKVGFLDGNCNLHIGDRVRYGNLAEAKNEFWDVQPADYILRDRDGSGKFERRPFADEVEPFNELIYFGGKPHRMALNKELTRLRLESCESLCGTLDLPGSEIIRRITLLKQSRDGGWECLVPEIAHCEIQLPPGHYRLFNCRIGGRRADSDRILGIGRNTEASRDILVEAGRQTALPLGAPLGLDVKVEKLVERDWDAYMSLGPNQSAYYLRITARVVGAGGELYRRFYRVGESKIRIPLKAANFYVLNERHSQIDRGKMEFGPDGNFVATWIVSKNVLRYDHSVGVFVDYDLGSLMPDGKPLRSQDTIISFADQENQ